MDEQEVIFTLNGPIKISANAVLKDHDGRVLPKPSGEAVFLCRCGASANKPFCDGAHKNMGFDGTLAAKP